MNILVSNVGSTSLKFKLFAMPEEQILCEAKVERVGCEDAIYHYSAAAMQRTKDLPTVPIKTYSDGIRMFLEDLCSDELGVIGSTEEIAGVGFKTVLAHGFNGVFLLDDAVMEAMKRALSVAPVHNAAYLQAIAEFQGILKNVPMVGVFETAFHATIPLKNRMYAIPYEWYEKYGIAKNGYHGASFGYIAEKAAEDGACARVIGCHLGGSSSVCAIRDGKSIDTSFGFSLQTGLPHANRCGDADPYLVPYLMSEGLTMEEIMEGMSRNGGLKGISGVSNDLREIQAAAGSGNARARLAVDVYTTAIIRFIGAFYAELGGLDKLVFTGGIGENSAAVRKAVCDPLAHLGIRIDEKKNNTLRGEGYINEEDSGVRVQVIKANEELGVARKTYACMLE